MNQTIRIKIATICLLFGLFVHSTNSYSNEKVSNFDISNYVGKVVYLDFWASWCIPCRKSFPWMNKLHNKYLDQGLIVIAVNLDEEISEAERFLTKYPADFIIDYDNGQLAEKYNVVGMPYSVLFDQTGKIASKHIGFKEKESDQMENDIRKLLMLNEGINE